MRSRGAALVFALVAGCVSPPPSADDLAAGRHMRLAETLERGGSLREATLEYTLVAELYPEAEAHQGAVLKAALLLSNPMNPAANDSLAAHWLNYYRGFSLSFAELLLVDLAVARTETLMRLKCELARESAVSDSLGGTVRRQSGELSQRAQRIRDLETELQKTSAELKKLREVDIQTHKERRP